MKVIKYTILILIVSCSSLPSSRTEFSEYSSKPLSEQLKSFSSDGCSSWPDGISSSPKLWLKCCYKHDQIYWLGGTERQRKNADRELKSCVKENFKNYMGIIMYLGVRVGGSARYETDYRWGYGWNYQRGYIALTKKELEYARQVSPKEGEPMSKYIKTE